MKKTKNNNALIIILAIIALLVMIFAWPFVVGTAIIYLLYKVVKSPKRKAMSMIAVSIITVVGGLFYISIFASSPSTKQETKQTIAPAQENKTTENETKAEAESVPEEKPSTAEATNTAEAIAPTNQSATKEKQPTVETTTPVAPANQSATYSNETPVTPPPVSTSGVVKKSSTGICHTPGSTYYDKTKNFIPYDSVDECLSSGGRLPKK